MILIAFGANIPGPLGSPEQTIRAVPQFLEDNAVSLLLSSSLYFTPPVGPGRQEAYVNAVAIVKTDLAPATLLNVFHRIEFQCGRRRSTRWGPRRLDLDLLAYNRMVTGKWRRQATGRGAALILPHPNLAQRSFVMRPLAEIAPEWRHPYAGVTAAKTWQRMKSTRQAKNITRICGPEWMETL